MKTKLENSLERLSELCQNLSPDVELEISKIICDISDEKVEQAKLVLSLKERIIDLKSQIPTK